MTLPPLWRIEELLAPSDDYPSGLQWLQGGYGRVVGGQAGRLNKATNLYVLSIDNQVYLAHRVLCYLKTKEDLSGFIVRHKDLKVRPDNRGEFVLIPVKNKKKF